MSNPSRRKGSAWEGAVRDFFNAAGVFATKVQRAPLWGAADQGDLLNTGAFTIECKATKTLDLASFVDQAEREAKNAGTRWGVAVVKRRNHMTDKAYVVMTLATFIDIAKELPLGHR